MKDEVWFFYLNQHDEHTLQVRQILLFKPIYVDHSIRNSKKRERIQFSPCSFPNSKDSLDSELHP